VSDLIRYALACVARSLPGRYDALATHLVSAPEDAKRDFHRLIQAYETELIATRRKVREPWRR
jgi:hypothetical protein